MQVCDRNCLTTPLLRVSAQQQRSSRGRQKTPKPKSPWKVVVEAKEASGYEAVRRWHGRCEVRGYRPVQAAKGDTATARTVERFRVSSRATYRARKDVPSKAIKRVRSATRHHPVVSAKASYPTRPSAVRSRREVTATGGRLLLFVLLIRVQQRALQAISWGVVQNWPIHKLL